MSLSRYWPPDRRVAAVILVALAYAVIITLLFTTQGAPETCVTYDAGNEVEIRCNGVNHERD